MGLYRFLSHLNQYAWSAYLRYAAGYRKPKHNDPGTGGGCGLIKSFWMACWVRLGHQEGSGGTLRLVHKGVVRGLTLIHVGPSLNMAGTH